MRLTILTVIALATFLSCAEKKQPVDNRMTQEIIPVKLLELSSGSSQHLINTSGLLSTENEADLSFKVGGVIESVLVKEGDRVKKGQLLASLKSTEIAAQVQQAQLSYEKAQRDLQRSANLYKDSVVTLEQMQNAKTAADLSKQALQQVLFNQQYSKIYSPADGFVTRKKGNPGEYMAAGTNVFVINASSSSSKWILKAGLSDQDWAAVATGNRASVSIEAFPGKTFWAVVSKRSLSADAASGSFGIELQVDMGQQQPAIGMFGKATITPSGKTDAYNIPYEALLEANGRTGFVFVSDDAKTVKKVKVDIAEIAGNTVSVSAGLNGHRYLVTSGSPYLSDHSTIKPL